MPRLGVFGRGAWLFVLLVALGGGRASGDAAMQFDIAGIEGDGWRAAGVSVTVRRTAEGVVSASVAAAQLQLPEPVGLLETVSGECADLVITGLRFSCRSLLLDPGGTLPAPLRLAGRAEYRRDTGALSWQFSPAGESPATLSFGGSVSAAGWTLRLEAVDHDTRELLPWLAAWQALPAPDIEGRVWLSGSARGAADGLQGLVFDLRVAGMRGANEPGTMAVENMEFELRGSAWRDGGRLEFDARGTAGAGEAYFEPVYADVGAHPVRVAIRGSVEGDLVEVRQLVVALDDVLHADVQAAFVPGEESAWRMREARARIAEAVLPGAYTLLLQPFLAGTAFDDLESSGSMRGEIVIRDHEPEELLIEFIDVQLDDRAARLAIYDLSGEFAWASGGAENAGPPQPMSLRWGGGYVYGIPFGAARVRMESHDGRWSLPSPVSIPVLDGAVQINVFEIGDFMTGDETVLFDARLAPLSMLELSRALGWPPLSGQLSGALPSLAYEDGVLTLGGELTAEVFSGVIAVRDLRIERPLQPLARLQAEVELSGLELADVTEALAFGLMTGRVDGYVRGLEMIDWAPVAFDARIHTPPGSRARQRISQRAVDNIASIGGGGAGLLSTGFLRFFEDFSYAGFALGCRLERDTCEMSGLEPRDGGYVILRGSGLPRIDVMGFARQVSWSALVEQLAGLREAGGPEIR
jgi:hypothetical protein